MTAIYRKNESNLTEDNRTLGEKAVGDDKSELEEVINKNEDKYFDHNMSEKKTSHFWI